MKSLTFIVLTLLLWGCDAPSTDQLSSGAQHPEEKTIVDDQSNSVQPSSNKNYQEFYPGGALKIEGNYNEQKQRNGLWVSYYENGVKWSETSYSNGIKNGHTIAFFPNGKVRYIGEYANDQKAGEWKFYDENGSLIEMETY